MRDRLSTLLETADLAIASCAGVLDDADLEPVKAVVGSLRARLGYPDDILVVALAGGTGSGKSSLFNALAGEDLAVVGGARPTTTEPQAAVPVEAGGSLDGYLDFLGVIEADPHPGKGLCLIDLPDTDSVEVEHRHRVDALLPLVDVVVWVTDPEKYRDARLHREYLRPLAMYAPQFVCVLNQMDRLEEEDLAKVTADLSRALVEDGLAGVRVIAAAASPPAGPPVGIDLLADALEAKRTNRFVLYEKLLTDLHQVVTALGHLNPVDFDERASRVVDTAIGSIESQDPTGAAEALEAFLLSLAVETGGPIGLAIHSLAADVPRHLARIVTGSPKVGARRRLRWLWWRRAGVAPPDVGDSINEAIVRPARALLARRALAGAAVAELAVGVASLRSTVFR